MIEIELSASEGDAVRETIKFTRAQLDGWSDDAKTVFFMEFGKAFMADMKANKPKGKT